MAKLKRGVSERKPNTFRMCLLFHYWYNSNHNEILLEICFSELFHQFWSKLNNVVSSFLLPNSPFLHVRKLFTYSRTFISFPNLIFWWLSILNYFNISSYTLGLVPFIHLPGSLLWIYSNTSLFLLNMWCPE